MAFFNKLHEFDTKFLTIESDKAVRRIIEFTVVFQTFQNHTIFGVHRSGPFMCCQEFDNTLVLDPLRIELPGVPMAFAP